MKMITVKKQFQFSANDFFDYLDKQLTLAIQQARKNELQGLPTIKMVLIPKLLSTIAVKNMKLTSKMISSTL